jgi:ketosteroid isomerase-like protein
MSQEAIDTMRRVFEMASRVKDPTGRVLDILDPESRAVVYDFLDPDIEFHEDPSFPETGTFRGIAAVRQYYEQFTAEFDEFTFEAEEFIDAGQDRVLILFHTRMRGKGSGAVVEARPGWIYTVRDGKAVALESYLDQREAVAAVDRERK